MFQEMPRLKREFRYSFMGQMYFLGMSSVKSFCPRRTSERRTHSFYLFLLFHMYLQARAVDKYNTGLIALEMVPCLYVWWLSAWIVKHTLLQHAASLTLSGPWSAVAVAGCHPRPSVQHKVWEVRVTQPVKEAQPVGSFCFVLLGKVVL